MPQARVAPLSSAISREGGPWEGGLMDLVPACLLWRGQIGPKVYLHDVTMSLRHACHVGTA